MKRIKRLILKTKINIFLTILWVILTGLYWNKFDISDYNKYASASLNESTIAFDVEANNGYILNVVNNNKSEDIEKMTLKVYNETYMNKYYRMAIKIDKSCNYTKLNALINEENYNLSELLIHEDENYYYFQIGENSLVDKIDIYEIGFFVDEKDLPLFLGKNFNIKFVDLNKEII